MQATCQLPPDIVQAPDTGQCKPWHQNHDIAHKHSQVRCRKAPILLACCLLAACMLQILSRSQALNTITALNKNIAEETLAQIEVGHGLFCKVLTPLQACSAYVGELCFLCRTQTKRHAGA
jgi:hypothetical protein